MKYGDFDDKRKEYGHYSRDNKLIKAQYHRIAEYLPELIVIKEPYKLIEDDDYLLISGIQHFAFCKRQWALIHIEKANREINGLYTYINQSFAKMAFADVLYNVVERHRISIRRCLSANGNFTPYGVVFYPWRYRKVK